MTRPHQLDQTLRTLKLSGMLDTLDTRLAQATAGDLGHLEFLQALCEDEIARRDAHAIGRRVRAARFEQPTTLKREEPVKAEYGWLPRSWQLDV
jgi:DNA replication protein DnaC